MALPDVVSHLSSAAVYLPVLAALTGGVLSKVKPFLPDEEQAENKIDFKKQAMFEKVTRAVQEVLKAALKMPDIVDLRGNPPREPDRIADLVNEVFRVLHIVREFDAILLGIRRGFSVLFFTTVLGLVGFLLALFWDVSRPVVAIAAIVLILSQIGVVCIVRRQAARVKDLVRTA